MSLFQKNSWILRLSFERLEVSLIGLRIIDLLNMLRRSISRVKRAPKKERKSLKKELQRSSRIVRRNTPLLKYWVGEKSVQHARDCLQIFGGYGYTREYTPERWLRESVIYSLYEGTSVRL